MATLKTVLNLLSYTDDVSSNAPKEVLQDLKKEFIDESITSVDSKLVTIPALAVDTQVVFDIAAIKYLLIQNRSLTHHLQFKINGTGNQVQYIASDGVLFLKSANELGVGQITTLHVSNPDPNTSITLRIFAAK